MCVIVKFYIFLNVISISTLDVTTFQCVGLYNHKYFYLFLTYLGLYFHWKEGEIVDS